MSILVVIPVIPLKTNEILRSHTRHPSGSVLGQLTLGLSLPLPSASSIPISSFFSLPSILETLAPNYTTLPLSISFLNSLENRLAPRNKDENLESGRLQLAAGTVVGVDLIQLGEGTLGDHGTDFPSFFSDLSPS